MYESPDIIRGAGEVLRSPLPKDLKKHAQELLKLRLDVSECLVDTYKLLYDKRKQMLWPKDVPLGKKEPTELDRATYLAADVSVIDRDCEFLKRIEKLVENRYELTILLLK